MSTGQRGLSDQTIERRFQMRYTLYFMGSVTLGILTVIVPTYFFINQNYRIFVELAQQHSPDLLYYLEREKVGMNKLLFSVGVSLLAFSWILGLRITKHIISPIKVLKKHLEQVTKGYWFMPEIQIQKDDEFQDTIHSYNDFYRSFRHHLESDLQRLQSLKIDPHHQESYKNWKTMVEEKTFQLNKKDS